MNAFVRKGDFWSGLALAALGCYIVEEASRWIYVGDEGPGPGFFPMWYGGAMIVLSLLLVAGAVLKGGPLQSRQIAWHELRRALTCWAAFAVCIGAMHVVGFMIAFGLLAWFMVAIMFRQSHAKAALVAVCGSVGFHLLFERALDLTLPQGVLF